jgi:hypothetical protein
MKTTRYLNRKAVQLDNEQIQVTITEEGGHVAEILHKGKNINPLWTPPWPTMEPSLYEPASHPQYGQDAEARLLAGILGHNLCLDIFGPPSEQEASAGLSVHGEASVSRYEFAYKDDVLTMRTVLPLARIEFERRVHLKGDTVFFEEKIVNQSPYDKPIAWTQHVTLGSSFLKGGKTRFALTAKRAKTFEGEFGTFYPAGREFDWPTLSLSAERTVDLATYPQADTFAGYAAHEMDKSLQRAGFIAHCPTSTLSFGYRWLREDFPWCGIWDEHLSRESAPWNGHAIARGMEFGVSPFPEPRRAMVERKSLFGTPAFKWLEAKSELSARYEARIWEAERLEEGAEWIKD